MVTAFELEDVLAPRDGTSQPRNRHSRFGAAGREAHHLHVRHPFGDLVGQLHLPLGGHTEAGPVLHGPRHRVEDDVGGMAQHQRAPRQDVIEILVAVGVPHPRAFTALGHERLSTHAAKGAHGRVHATRKTRTRSRHDLGGPHARARRQHGCEFCRTAHRPKLPTEELSGMPLPTSGKVRDARRTGAVACSATRNSVARKS